MFDVHVFFFFLSTSLRPKIDSRWIIQRRWVNWFCNTLPEGKNDENCGTKSGKFDEFTLTPAEHLELIYQSASFGQRPNIVLGWCLLTNICLIWLFTDERKWCMPSRSGNTQMQRIFCWQMMAIPVGCVRACLCTGFQSNVNWICGFFIIYCDQYTFYLHKFEELIKPFAWASRLFALPEYDHTLLRIAQNCHLNASVCESNRIQFDAPALLRPSAISICCRAVAQTEW